MHRSRAPSIAPGIFFVAQSWADCITNMAGFNLRQAQEDPPCLFVLLARTNHLRDRIGDVMTVQLFLGYMT